MLSSQGVPCLPDMCLETLGGARSSQQGLSCVPAACCLLPLPPACSHDGSNVGAASPTSPNKVWWAQAEALLGFDWLHKQTGKAIHRAKFAQTLNFIRSHLWDKQYGE